MKVQRPGLWFSQDESLVSRLDFNQALLSVCANSYVYAVPNGPLKKFVLSFAPLDKGSACGVRGLESSFVSSSPSSG